MQIKAIAESPMRSEEVAPIAWFEGLQLLPQHFQTWDRRMEAVVRRYAQGCGPHYWGIDELTYDTVALAAGRLRVLSASGIFPDGLAFSFDSQSHGAMEYELAEGPYPLRLALAVPRSGMDRVASEQKRFRQWMGEPVADRFNSDEKASIARLIPCLSVHPYAPQGLGDHVLLPVIEIKHGPTGFEVTDYHPPASRLIAESETEKLATGVAALLRQKANLVRGRPALDQTGANWQNRYGWTLSCLVSALPLLEARLTERASPFDVYIALCAVAGAVAPIAGVVPPSFPRYEHLDPAMAIQPVAEFVREVAEGFRLPWFELPFEVKSGIWSVTVPPSHAKHELLVLIRLNGQNSAEKTADWINNALICIESDLAQCREMRVRGLNRRQISSSAEYGVTASGTHKLISIEMLDGTPRDARGNRLLVEVPQDKTKTFISEMALLVSSV